MALPAKPDSLGFTRTRCSALHHHPSSAGDHVAIGGTAINNNSTTGLISSRPYGEAELQARIPIAGRNGGSLSGFGTLP